MDYKSFLEHIYLRHSANVKLGLDRMHDILQKMDNPEKKLKGIHVAGTNGKGSTSAICEALLFKHGHKTGLNTSPHLIDYTERFRINTIVITSDELMDLYHQYEKHFEDSEASFFEITTALAFQLFVDRNVDSAVIEVGLGGRLDGTNPFNSSVSVITSIAIDHPKSLGDTVEKIAYEKAGIIKSGKPVVIGDLQKNALDVVINHANSLNSKSYLINRDFYVENVRLTAEGTCFDYRFPECNLNLYDLNLNLLGLHQANNAGLALTACCLYLNSINQRFNEDFFRDALKTVNWPGRIQILSRKPLVVIDGAHNEEGVSTLIKSLKKIFPDYRYHFLVAILRDKKLDNMIKEICTVAEDIYISKNHSDRAADIQEQVDVAIGCNTKYFADDDIVESAKKCLSTLQDEKEMMVITGSLYTIAEILKIKDQLFKDN